MRARVLGDLGVDHDLGGLEPAAWTQDALDLGEHGLLVGHEVDDAVGDHHVDRSSAMGRVSIRASCKSTFGSAR
jgi:hypothetical protein